MKNVVFFMLGAGYALLWAYWLWIESPGWLVILLTQIVLALVSVLACIFVALSGGFWR